MGLVDGGERVRGEGAGHDEELAVFLHDHAADDDSAVLEVDLLARVLVADDLGGLDDVFCEVADGVAAARAG